MTAFQTGLNTFAGTLNLTSGPPLGAVPFDPTLVQRMPVGSATLTFADGNNGTFAYTVNGISADQADHPPGVRRAADVRLGRACRSDAGHQLHGHVVGGRRSGIGVGHQFRPRRATLIFATWFTYDFTGAALPMSATADQGWGRTSTRAR